MFLFGAVDDHVHVEVDDFVIKPQTRPHPEEVGGADGDPEFLDVALAFPQSVVLLDFGNGFFEELKLVGG